MVPKNTIDDVVRQKAERAAIEAYEAVLQDKQEADTNPRLGFRERLAKRLAGKDWPRTATPTQKTSTAGVLSAEFDEWTNAFFAIDTERIDIYSVLEEMETTMEEVSTALDIMADEAVNPESGSHEPFRIDYEIGYTPPRTVKKIIENVLADTQLLEKSYGIIRDCLLYGDNFQQIIVNNQLEVIRLMHMPVKTMVRHEDDHGLLLTGSTEGEFAFEQYSDGISNFIAGFFPFQIEHLRWNRRGSDPYGRSLFYSARGSYKKLRSMEEALSINWLTRAFARLLFAVDTTGMSPAEAKQAITDFRMSLQMQQVSSDTLGEKQMTVPKDIFLGRGYHQYSARMFESLSNVSVLDTSNTGFWNLNPVEYYRDKVILPGRVPRAYLGLPQEIRTKEALAQLDRRFARAVRRAQQVLSFMVIHVIDLALVLKGQNPFGIPYKPLWPTTSLFDELDRSQALLNFGRASVLFRRLQALDAEFAAKEYIRMTPGEWNAITTRLEKQLKDQLELLHQEGVVGDMLQVASGYGTRKGGGMGTEPPEGSTQEPVDGEQPGAKPNA